MFKQSRPTSTSFLSLSLCSFLSFSLFTLFHYFTFVVFFYFFISLFLYTSLSLSFGIWDLLFFPSLSQFMLFLSYCLFRCYISISLFLYSLFLSLFRLLKTTGKVNVRRKLAWPFLEMKQLSASSSFCKQIYFFCHGKGI